MAGQNFKNCPIFMKMFIHWVFASLISDTLLDFWNLKFQYDRKKFRKISNFYRNLYMGVFGDANYEFAVRFWKFKMAVRIWRSTSLKIVLFTWKSYENLFTVGFWVPNSEFAVSVSKIQNGGLNIAVIF